MAVEIARGSISDVYPPTHDVFDRHTVTLGGKRVTMTYLGIAHADDSSVLHFPDERAVFSADILQVKRLPGGLAPHGWRLDRRADDDQRARLRARAHGHALAGTKKDAAESLRYLEDISKGCGRRHRAGRSSRRDSEDADARCLQEL
jgi:glyoxylase-like metal-dependent hydrolase (beta-lactamase superfamily II)